MVESLGATQVDNRYARLMQIAISGLRDLHNDRPSTNKFATLPILSNHTVTLPNDYIDYVRIGVCYNGSVIALGENPIMCPPHTDDCGNIEVDQPSFPTVPDAYPTYPYGAPFLISGAYSGRMYGIGGGNNSIGYYKVFKDEGYIALQAMSGEFDEIILEYVGDLTQVDGQFVVHPFDVEAVKAWMWWKWVQRAKSYTQYDKEMSRIAYGNEKRKASGRHGRMPMNELLQVLRSGYKSSPKL